MTNDAAIRVQDVSKKFRLFRSARERLVEALHPFRKQLHREFWALREVSFEIGRGEIFGIMGRNGSGKSTLLQIICSVMRATSGSVHVFGRISALLELGAGFNPEFTGRENVILNGAILGLSRKEMLRRIDAIETFAEIGEFFDQPVKTYSSGMFVRVAFSAAIHVDPEILVVDEALSVGDSAFQHRCFQRIRDFMEMGKTIVVVSHSTDTLLRICQRGAVIDAGRLVHVGAISSAVNCYQDLLFGPAKRGTVARDISMRQNAQASRPERISAHEDGELAAVDFDKVPSKAFYNPHEIRLGSREVQIVEIDFLVDGKQNPREIGPGAEVRMTVKILFDVAKDDVSVGFAIVTVDGTYIFGTNLAMMGSELLSGKAGDCIAVRFTFKSRIAGGDLFWNVGCDHMGKGGSEFLDVRRSVVKMKFGETPSVTGFVELDVRREVIALVNSLQFAE